MSVTITLEKLETTPAAPSLTEEVLALKAAMDAGQILNKDMSFANSLYSQWKLKGKLSDKQRPWLAKLIENGKDKCGSVTMPGGAALQYKNQVSLKVEAPNKAPLGCDVAPLFELFATALKHLKKPAIELETYKGLPIRIQLASAPYTNGAAQINGPVRLKVTTAAAYPHSKFVGFLDAYGTYQPSYKFEDQEPIKSLLRRFAANPAEAAAKYGKLTGKCCFCGLSLTDPKSTAAGYGPKCAKHFHLPWG